MSQWEIIFHVAELAVLIFGVAAPLIWSWLRLRSLLKDFPPHRHVDGVILYPQGYTPGRVEHREVG